MCGILTVSWFCLWNINWAGFVCGILTGGWFCVWNINCGLVLCQIWVELKVDEACFASCVASCCSLGVPAVVSEVPRQGSQHHRQRAAA